MVRFPDQEHIPPFVLVGSNFHLNHATVNTGLPRIDETRRSPKAMQSKLNNYLQRL